MKGQSTIEFLGGILLFLIVLVGSLTLMSDRIPEFTNDIEQSSRNIEMYRVTNQILSESGRHGFGSGGTNWEKNSSTVSNIEEFGLAKDYHVLAMDKISNISTTGDSQFNYSQFHEIEEVRNQYRFNFVWFPIVETSGSFTRTMPPNNPPILEPKSPEYSNAENTVNYGSINMLGTNYKLLVAAFDGVYNTTYVSDDWNFTQSTPQGIGDKIALSGKSFEIIKFQNRDRRPGASVVLRRQLKTFGVNSQNLDTTVTKLNRYAVLEAPATDREVIRMEVLAW